MKKLFSLDNVNVIANVVTTVCADISKKYPLLQILSQTYTARTTWIHHTQKLRIYKHFKFLQHFIALYKYAGLIKIIVSLQA